MSVGPVEDTLQQRRSVVPQPSGQRRCLFRSEIPYLHPLTDIKRGNARVLDQIGRGSRSQQAEAKTAQFRLRGSAHIALTDGSKKLIGGEWEGTNDVYLIYKNNNPAGDTLEGDVFEGLLP